MKILIISPADLPIPATKGGAIETLVTYVLNENEEKNKLDIDVITPYQDGLESEVKKYKNCKFIIFNSNRKTMKLLDIMRKVVYKVSRGMIPYFDEFTCFAKKYVRQNSSRYQAVIFEGNSMQALAMKNKDSKNILHIHTDVFNLEFRYAHKVNRYVDEYWGVSKYIEQQIRKVVGEEKKIRTLMNCADLSSFDKSRYENTQALRESFDLKKDDFVVIFAGRLDPQKGVKELVQAILNLNKSDIKLVVVGGNNYSDNTQSWYIKELNEMIREHQDLFRFTGYMEHEKMPMMYAMADVAVVPSKCNEAAGLSLIEAKTMGCPVIATNRGGIPEYIGQGGILIDPKKNLVEKLQRAIEYLYLNELVREQLSYANMQERGKFSSQRYYDDFVELLNE